jgi:hypothetical protein
MKISVVSIILFLFLLLHLCSCSGEQPSSNNSDSLKNSSAVGSGTDTSASPQVKHPESVWTYDDVNSIAVRTGNTKIDTLTPVQLIEFFNATYTDSLQLQYQRINADTIFVRVLNAAYLTQRSGSTGAEAYLMIGTFTLTESPRINYVYFDFEEGDHAVPGTYSRKYWYDRAEANKALNNKLKGK